MPVRRKRENQIGHTQLENLNAMHDLIQNAHSGLKKEIDELMYTHYVKHMRKERQRGLR